MSKTYDAKHAREKAVEIVSDAGAYIATHAEDFVARADSDEAVLADGLDITVHVLALDEPPTITVTREMALQSRADGRGD